MNAIIFAALIAGAASTPVETVATTIADIFPSTVATTVADTFPAAKSDSACSSADPSGPKINVIFFSDDACQTTVPETIYTRNVFGSVPCCNNFPDQSYNSLIIDQIDDQIIGTNTALQVSLASSDQCDFAESIKFNVATRDQVGKCQFMGIPQGQGKPLGAGNEYRLTSLQ